MGTLLDFEEFKKLLHFISSEIKSHKRNLEFLND